MEVLPDEFYLKLLNLEMIAGFDVEEYLRIRSEKEEKFKKKNIMTVRRVKDPFKMHDLDTEYGVNYFNNSEDNIAKRYEDME